MLLIVIPSLWLLVAAFFVILSLTVVWMVMKLLRHLAQLPPEPVVCPGGEVV